jgi:hypothetical protein
MDLPLFRAWTSKSARPQTHSLDGGKIDVAENNDFQGTLAQMSQTIGTSGNELVALRGLRLLFRFELLTNLLRKAPERIVFSQLLQRIVFRWIGEGFSFEHVRAAIKR